jgi:uncharacterized protein (DUF302 family)
MERKIEMIHVSLELSADFASFTRAIERLLGKFDYSLLEGLESDPRSVEVGLDEAAGEEGLMLFNIQEHGKLLNIYRSPRKANQYVLGNPLIAIMMTRHDIRAGLYAPLRVFVYEADDRSTRIEYDQPSSLFGQFENPEVTNVARSLDTKLSNLIRKAERVAKASGAD